MVTFSGDGGRPGGNARLWTALGAALAAVAAAATLLLLVVGLTRSGTTEDPEAAPVYDLPYHEVRMLAAGTYYLYGGAQSPGTGAGKMDLFAAPFRPTRVRVAAESGVVLPVHRASGERPGFHHDKAVYFPIARVEVPSSGLYEVLVQPEESGTRGTLVLAGKSQPARTGWFLAAGVSGLMLVAGLVLLVMGLTRSRQGSRRPPATGAGNVGYTGGTGTHPASLPPGWPPPAPPGWPPPAQPGWPPPAPPK